MLSTPLVHDNHPLINRARKIAELQAERTTLAPDIKFTLNLDASREFRRLIRDQIALTMPDLIATRLEQIDRQLADLKRELRTELDIAA